MSHRHDDAAPKWKFDGVRVVKSGELDINTAQTPGMNRAAAITYARTGAEKLWAGTVVIHAKAKTGAHHHGHVESVIYVVKGKARMRWGEKLEFMAEAGPGDFLIGPRGVPHRFTVGDQPARMMWTFTPGGFERFVMIVADVPFDTASLPAALRGTTELPPGTVATSFVLTKDREPAACAR